MAAFECPRCHNQRSPRKLALCNICSFLDDLMQEHMDGFHRDRLNVSCELCKPRHRAELNTTESAAYIRRLTAPPLDKRAAGYLLKADREGIAFFARYGTIGSKWLQRFREHGHLMIEWHKGLPYIRVSAQSRHHALELLSTSQHTSDDVPARQRRSERSQSTSPRVAMSHATCKHERTAKARAKCRAERKAAS